MPRNKENDAKTCVRVFQEKGKRETHVKPCHAQNTKNGKDGRKDKLYLKHTSCLNHAFTAFYFTTFVGISEGQN